jgi:sulfur relay (sulfurtransferase) DsrF/TusC family protein
MEKETKKVVKPEEAKPEEVEEGMYCSTCKTYTMYEVGNVFLCDECGNWCYSSS